MRQLLQLLMVSLVLAALTVLIGCNTIEGAGKDVESAGEAIQNAAD